MSYVLHIACLRPRTRDVRRGSLWCVPNFVCRDRGTACAGGTHRALSGIGGTVVARKPACRRETPKQHILAGKGLRVRARTQDKRRDTDAGVVARGGYGLSPSPHHGGPAEADGSPRKSPVARIADPASPQGGRVALCARCETPRPRDRRVLRGWIFARRGDPLRPGTGVPRHGRGDEERRTVFRRPLSRRQRGHRAPGR